MNNCTAQVYADTDTLDAGRRVAGAEESDVLYSGPAYLAGPSRGWQQAAALEGLLSGTLHIHGAANLEGATRVLVGGHARSGEWKVADGALSGIGNQQRLTLQRRP